MAQTESHNDPVAQDTELPSLGESRDRRSKDPTYIRLSYLSASLDGLTLPEIGSPLPTPRLPFVKIPRCKPILRQDRWFQTEHIFGHKPYFQQTRRQYLSKVSGPCQKHFAAPSLSLQGITNGKRFGTKRKFDDRTSLALNTKSI